MQEVRLGNNPRIKLLGAEVDVLDESQTVSLVNEYIKTNTPLHLIGVNADKINAMQKDPEFSEIVNSCGVINADGASLVLASRFLGEPLPERVAGIDLMQRLVELSGKNQYKIFLLGAKESVVRQAAKVLKDQNPTLKIVGVRNGYFRREEWPLISKQLKELKPDLVFVGITSPLKEYLVEFLQADGNKSVFMGVGGSFDVISGKIPRAPLWMQKSNLEWLFRVGQEPKRLLRRYLFGNITFIWHVIKAKLSGNVKR
ncbi:WecB/TagA/CpsF family glycosyltransferase [Lacticaseibacillus jixianensis]|uniref:WecB/TagA/CpsF family glycosyltransferase n=1 Tax=Lacticaseibacillus jixianensis TaxID=2486012 RepID=A0ABW4BAE1_9LACO|nr:WecB/TagA/CpsF family glycosyltransferase [Lacticaseibacillus jixianensis]